MVADLRTKSVHDLRIIAQSFSVADIFEKDAVHLAQEIELKQQKLIPPPVILPPQPEYDARLMTKLPANRASPMEVTDLLTPYLEMGMKLSFDENAEHWTMSSGKKADTGTLRMPLRAILHCAAKVVA